MPSRHRPRIVVKLFPSIPKAAFGSARLADWLERHVFYREFHVSPWKVALAAGGVVALALWSVLGLALAAQALLHAAGLRADLDRAAELTARHQARFHAAQRDHAILLARLGPLNERVDEMARFAERLAIVTGVEGAADAVSRPQHERSASVALSEEAVAELGRRFDHLGTFLGSQEIELARTPSISPLKEAFVPTDRFGYRVSRFTRQETEGRGGGGREFHAGLDLAAKVGTPIHATADGTVHFAGRVPPRQSARAAQYGNFVVLDHGRGVRTLYAHCDQLNVVPGQTVRRGALVAWVGNTGRSTGPHVHYEVAVAGRPVDPELFVLDVEIPDRRVQVAFDDHSLLMEEVDRLLAP